MYNAILDVLYYALDLYRYVVLIAVAMSWLLSFNVINIHNDFVRSIWNATEALTEPFLRPIRRLLPAMGGLDISPVILLLIVYFLQSLIWRQLHPAYGAYGSAYGSYVH